jgi:hypothetical protein
MIVCKVCACGIHKRVLAPSSLQIMSFTGVDSIFLDPLLSPMSADI